MSRRPAIPLKRFVGEPCAIPSHPSYVVRERELMIAGMGAAAAVLSVPCARVGVAQRTADKAAIEMTAILSTTERRRIRELLTPSAQGRLGCGDAGLPPRDAVSRPNPLSQLRPCEAFTESVS